MNPELEIDGKRLAKTVASRMKAYEILRAPSSKATWWHLGLAVVVGTGMSWFGAHAGSNSVFAIGIAAEIGFLLAANAYFECVRLRKRLDAAIVLLLERDPSI